MALVEGHVVVFLFRGYAAGHTASGECGFEFVVGEDIQFLLLLALRVFVACCANDIYQARLVNFAVDYFGGQAQRREQRGQGTGRLWIFGLAFDDEFAQSNRCLHVVLAVNEIVPAIVPLKRCRDSLCEQIVSWL